MDPAASRRVLHVDAREGATADSLLAALLDLGTAPSPLLAAVADLALPVELRLEPGRVAARPERGALLVSPRDVRDALHPLAADALGRLLVDEARGDALASLVDGVAVALLHAAAIAVEDLMPDLVTVAGGGRPSPEARALLEALTEGEDAVDREPEWVGHPARGEARDGPRTRVALGRARQTFP